LQEGQTKISRSARMPSFKIVRELYIVSPQQRHTNVAGPIGCRAGAATAQFDGR
jgi:hypothetical protein